MIMHQSLRDFACETGIVITWLWHRALGSMSMAGRVGDKLSLEKPVKR